LLIKFVDYQKNELIIHYSFAREETRAIEFSEVTGQWHCY